MKEENLDLSGPGLIRAVQEAIREKKHLVIVQGLHKKTSTLRYGYYLREKKITKLGATKNKLVQC